LRMPTKRPAQKDCRFKRVRCPPTAVSAAHSPRTETSARPASKSSSREDYAISRPSERPHIGRASRLNDTAKTSDPNVESGHERKSNCAPPSSAFPSTADRPQRNGHVSFVP
jgi:hypothetical protein